MGTTESAFFYEGSEEISHSQSTHSGSFHNPRTTPLPPAAAAIGTTAQQIHARKRGPPRSVAATSRLPIAKLKGHILGRAESGKRTLLARLQGKDPFQPSIDDAPVLEGVEHALPYKPPSEQPAWHRIQLLVNCAEDFVHAEPFDFVVILINPQHKRKKVKNYLVERLRNLMHILAYQTDGSVVKYPLRPLCLCLLVNFRDLTLSKTYVEESNLTMWTMEVLQEYPSLDPQRLVLQCGQASMKNCYGLSLLHHFIYQSYLFHRQFHLECEILKVRHTQQAAKVAPIQSYEEFLEIMEGKVPPPTQTTKKKQEQNNKFYEEDESTPKPSGRRKVIQNLRRQQQQPPADEDYDNHGPPSAPESSAPVKSSKDVLEAFLASSDEEEEVKPKGKQQHGSRGRKTMADEIDDDDDDDFVVAEIPPDHVEDSENSETVGVQSQVASNGFSKSHAGSSNSNKDVMSEGTSEPPTTDNKEDGGRKQRSSTIEPMNKSDSNNGSHESGPEEPTVGTDQNDAESGSEVDQSVDRPDLQNGNESMRKGQSGNPNGISGGDRETSTDSAGLENENGRSKIDANGTSKGPLDSASGSRDRTQVDQALDEDSHGITSCSKSQEKSNDMDAQARESIREEPSAKSHSNQRLSDVVPDKKPFENAATRSSDDNGDEQKSIPNHSRQIDDDMEQTSVNSGKEDDLQHPDLPVKGRTEKKVATDDDNSSDDEEFYVSNSKQVDEVSEKSQIDPDPTAVDQAVSQNVTDGERDPSTRTADELGEKDDEHHISKSLPDESISKDAVQAAEIKVAPAANEPKTSGLSAAALAAIAAAQRDFENMLNPEVEVKPKKKKKDKEKKKEKKKKKDAKGSDT